MLIKSQPDFYRIGSRYFNIALAAAFCLHLAGLVAYSLSPHDRTIEVPVRALNIKLGDDNTLVEQQWKAAQPDSANLPKIESLVQKMVRPEAKKKPEVAPKKSAEKTKAKPQEKHAADVTVAMPKQYVREKAKASSAGHELGNSESEKAEVLKRYEQLVSLWVQRFLEYPAESKRNGVVGSTMVYIRIDRRGNIGYYRLEHSTGSRVLDRAAIEMIQRANPVPAVPDDYPPGDLLEFLIPVNFHM